MNRNRLWVIGLVTAIVAVLLLSVLLGVTPALQQVHRNNLERASVENLNQTQALALTSLVSDLRNMTALTTKLAKANAALPPKPQLSSLLGELNSLEKRYGVRLTGYTGGDPQAFDAAAPGSPPAVPAASSASASTTTTAPVSSAPGLYSIPVQVQASGDYADLVDFVGGLQTGKRLFVVTTLTIGTGSSGGSFTATVNGYVYLLTEKAAAAQ